MASSQNLQQIVGIVTTTDNTQTTVVSYTVPTNTVVFVEADVIGKDASNNTIVAKKIAAAKRSAGGSSIVGSVIDVITSIVDTSLVGASATVDASSNDVRVRVTGKLATTIEWQCTLWVTLN